MSCKLYVPKYILGIVLSSFFISCSTTIEDPIAYAMASKSENITRVVNNLEEHKVQIILSELIEEKDSIYFIDYTFQINDSNYFYPAGAIKLPVALLSLEKLGADKRFDRETPFFVEGDTTKSTFEKEITRLFAIDEDKAYNKFYEYLGRDYINKKLKEKGFSNTRVSSRIGIADADDTVTKSLIFKINDSTLTSTNQIQDAPLVPLNLKETKQGTAYYENGSLVNSAFDFSLKNYISITDLHNTMKRIIAPEAFSPSEQFHIQGGDRKSLLRRMCVLPRETNRYSRDTTFYDSYTKFFMYGDQKKEIPEYMTLYSKSGSDYGYVTDCAYIEDNQNGVKFFLTATLYVNKDGIFNDNLYEYKEIGIPFLAELGRQIHHAMVVKKFQ